MTPEDVVSVVGLLAVTFDRRVDDEGVMYEAYEAALGDLDIEDPRGLVAWLLRSVEKWPAPATLRKLILGACGHLAPTEDAAWVAVREYAQRAAQQATAEELAPLQAALSVPAREALEAVGGTWALRVGDRGVVFAQFRDAYRLAAARNDQGALQRSWEGTPLQPSAQLPLRHGGGRAVGPGGHPGRRDDDDADTPGQGGGPARQGS